MISDFKLNTPPKPEDEVSLPGEYIIFELLKQNPILTYPSLKFLYPDTPLKYFENQVDYLLELGVNIRRFNSMGFVYGYSNAQVAENDLRHSFEADIFESVEMLPVKCVGHYAGKKYTFIQNKDWVSSLQNLVIVEDSEGNKQLLIFPEYSIPFEILLYLITSFDHSISYVELGLYCKTLGINISAYTYSGIYRWFYDLRTDYGFPIITSELLGFGLANPELESKDQTEILGQHLQAKTEDYFKTNLDNINCTTVGRIGETSFYFPKVDEHNLPRLAYVIVETPEGKIRVLDFYQQTTAKRVLESIIRNNGYIDQSTTVDALNSEWWQAQLKEEQSRSNSSPSEVKSRRSIDITNQDGYDFAISRVIEFLSRNNLPSLVRSEDVGYQLAGSTTSRRDFIIKRLMTIYGKVLSTKFSIADPETLGVDMFSAYPDQDTKILVFDLNTLQHLTRNQIYQPGIRKTFGAIFYRTLYNSAPIKSISAFVELTAIQAETLRLFIYSSTVALEGSKREIDNKRAHLDAMANQIKLSGFNIKPETGIIRKGVATIPIPELKELPKES